MSDPSRFLLLRFDFGETAAIRCKACQTQLDTGLAGGVTLADLLALADRHVCRG